MSKILVGPWKKIGEARARDREEAGVEEEWEAYLAQPEKVREEIERAVPDYLPHGGRGWVHDVLRRWRLIRKVT